MPPSTTFQLHPLPHNPVALPNLISAYEYTLLTLLNFQNDVRSYLPNYYIQHKLIAKTIPPSTLQKAREYIKSPSFLSLGITSFNDPVNILLAVCSHVSSTPPSMYSSHLQCSEPLISRYASHMNSTVGYSSLHSFVEGRREKSRDDMKKIIETNIGTDVPEEVRERLINKRITEESRKKRKLV
mmetsp:Transcript_20765/g.38805  ORF Transcript_20765/g.38805 Transcript_20765/m.38805 type:complete len:184 (+) Transcript_20765:206-757(+)